MTATIARCAIAAAALALIPSASPALAQARFVSATPPAGGKVSSATEIRLEFNESVDPRFSGLTLTTPRDVNVELGEPEVESSDPRALVVPVTNVLRPGAYTVHWRVMSFDSQSAQGEFSFTVKP